MSTGLKFDSEKSMEDWICDFWEATSIDEAFGGVKNGQFIKRVYDGVEAEDTAKLFRQLSIPNGNEHHDGNAPSDVVIAAPICLSAEADPKPTLGWKVLVIELKNRVIDAKDVAQVSRYMQGVRQAPELGDLEGPIEVRGALVGTGVSWAASDVLALCPGVLAFVLDIEGTYIDLSTAYCGRKFDHIEKAPEQKLAAVSEREF